MRASLSRLVVCACVLACSDDESAGPTKAELEVQIETEIQRLNSCTVVDDCQRVGYPRCSSSYIGVEADRIRLDELLADYYRGDDLICAAICACALLRCVEGRCDLSAGDCNPTPDEGVATCF
jgi:hypothetical protein